MNYKSKELAVFYEKLGQLYRAGVSINEGLLLASMEIKDKKLRASLERVHNYLMRGRTLTESFAQSPDVFSEMDLALIGVGETEGRLDQSLMNLSTLYEREYKDTKTFIFALIYPTFLLCSAILLPPIVTWFNEGFTAYLHSVSSTVFTIVIPGAIIYGIYYAFKSSSPDVFDRVLISIPILGINLQKMALARFSRSLATLFSSGIDLRRCLRFSVKSMANKYMERRCRIIEKALDEGQTIASGLKAANVFPANFVQTFAIGEQTGELDKMLLKMAEYYEFEADKAFKAILTMLPVVIYLFVAAYIGYIVISFYANYFNTIGNMTK